MRVRVVSPSPDLAPFVRRIEIVEASEAATRVLFPEPGLLLGIRFAGKAVLQGDGGARELPRSTVTGMRGTVRRMHTAAEGGIVVVKFRPEGAAALFEPPLHESYGAILPLADWFRASEVGILEERLAEAPDHSARITVVEAFLRERLRDHRADPLIGAAVEKIHRAPGEIRIARLADELGLSVDALEKRFRRAVGCSPKQFASILRMRKVVRGLRSGMSLTELALEAGYYDQSHFIRHFRAMAGMSPRRFLSNESFC